ncbi:manganese efflux pump MntP family protein [Gallaecimonas kandeliae]|uniref:manganese efflux pump MntP n=1 Tax=Gallaecimonas kandeliae TaxID=3029055 RepID=UPI0026480F2B|nr:manganese efflux pump MntP family protein [Gallaecimonas kandeliae]WKE67280.1 manganese efflux pump MntP family protein [Gallaecimonas kandeliae]
MSLFSLILIAFAMSTDAFAVALARGAALRHPRFSHALKDGLLFGLVEGLTPLLGWLLGVGAAGYIAEWDHWLAFGLLSALGAKMIHEGLQAPDTDVEPRRRAIWLLLVTAMATSVDALVVGLGFAFVKVDILVASLLIGLATTLMVTLGLLVGRQLGSWLGKKAEVAGGLVLIVVGSLILRQHLLGLA